MLLRMCVAVVSRLVKYNFGLEGCLVSVGFVGTSYDTDGTNLGTACSSASDSDSDSDCAYANTLECSQDYRSCLASPYSCTYLCAAPSLPGFAKPLQNDKRGNEAKRRGAQICRQLVGF